MNEKMSLVDMFDLVSKTSGLKSRLSDLAFLCDSSAQRRSPSLLVDLMVAIDLCSSSIVDIIHKYDESQNNSSEKR